MRGESSALHPTILQFYDVVGGNGGLVRWAVSICRGGWTTNWIEGVLGLQPIFGPDRRGDYLVVNGICCP